MADLRETSQTAGGPAVGITKCAGDAVPLFEAFCDIDTRARRWSRLKP